MRKLFVQTWPSTQIGEHLWHFKRAANLGQQSIAEVAKIFFIFPHSSPTHMENYWTKITTKYLDLFHHFTPKYSKWWKFVGKWSLIHSGIFHEEKMYNFFFFYFVRFRHLAAVAWCAKFGDIKCGATRATRLPVKRWKNFVKTKRDKKILTELFWRIFYVKNFDFILKTK